MNKLNILILSFILLFSCSTIGYGDDSREFYKDAMKHFKRGDKEFAFSKFNRIVEAYPNSKYADEAMYRIAEYHYEINNQKDAEKYFKLHRNKFPKSTYHENVNKYLSAILADQLMERANLSLQNNDPESAFAQLKEIKKINFLPNNTDTTNRITQLNEKLYNFIIAKADYEFKDQEFQKAFDLYQKASFLNNTTYIENQLLNAKKGVDFAASQKAKGLIKFQGSWMSPSDKEAREKTNIIVLNGRTETTDQIEIWKQNHKGYLSFLKKYDIEAVSLYTDGSALWKAGNKPVNSRLAQKLNYCYDKFQSKRIDIIEAILEDKVLIGMTTDEVLMSIGRPSDINRSEYPHSVHEQWVYDYYGRKYIYFEDGIVTAIQN